MIASHILIPELIEGRIDVERHYYDTRTLFFGILAVTGLWAMFLEPITGVRTFAVPFRFLQASGILVLIACAVSKNRRLHAGATAFIVLLITFAISFTRFRLGQMDLKI